MESKEPRADVQTSERGETQSLSDLLGKFDSLSPTGKRGAQEEEHTHHPTVDSTGEEEHRAHRERELQTDDHPQQDEEPCPPGERATHNGDSTTPLGDEGGGPDPPDPVFDAQWAFDASETAPDDGGPESLGRETTPFESDDEAANESTTDADGDASERDVEETADELFRLLLDNEDGCTEDDHTQAHNLHMSREGTNHHDLSATYQEPGGRDTLTRRETGLHSDGFPVNLGKPRSLYTSARGLADFFEGAPDLEQPVRNICLHEEVSRDTTPLRSFDIDSVLAFPSSFGAFRKGLRYSPAMDLAHNIQTDLHLARPVTLLGRDGRARRESRQLRDIPHLYIGSVDGFFRSTVYLFFPELIEDDKKFTYLTAMQVKRFTDQGLWPACRQHLEQDRVQHFPPSQELAEDRVRARGIERQAALGERGRKQHISFYLPPDKLPHIWETLQARIRDPVNGLKDFGGNFLFVNVKGVKMDFKVAGSLHKALSDFEIHLGQIFDLDLMDDMIQDIGREICPSSPPPAFGGQDSDEEALVYLWKTCCLRHQHRSFVDGAFGGKRGRVAFFHIGFLRDAACMSVVPPKTSRLRRGGWLYGQWYASVKEIADAQTCYPFGHENLKELAVDAAVWKANASSAKVSHVRSREYLVRSYCGSKERVRRGYSGSERTSFGARVEFRVDWRLFQAIKRRAARREAEAEPPLQLAAHPRSVWPLTTKSYARFIQGNYEKMTSALEIASVTSPRTGVSLERSRLMAMLIKCLQKFANSDLSRDSALWFENRAVDGRARRGLGFESTVAAHGFAWFVRVVDWENLRFQPAVAVEMVGADRQLLSWHGAAGRLIQDAAQVLDFCLGRLANGRDRPQVHDEMLVLLAHICLRQYRRDVLKALAGELRRTVETDEERDAVPFCYEGVCEAFIDVPNLAKGNKTKTKHPDEMWEWLWGVSEKYNRKHFQDKPFRIMCQKVTEAARERTKVRERWTELLRREFLQYHWLLPYPDVNGTLISTAKGSRARQWWAINKKKGEREAWEWARDKPRPGHPEAYPRTLDMTVEGLTVYLERVGKEWM